MYCNILILLIVNLPAEGSLRIHDWYDISNPSGADFAKGAVEIFHSGVWGSICGSNNDDSIAVIACKQLGYSAGYRKSYCCDYTSSSTKIWVNKMTCNGNETSLMNCSFAYGTDTYSCSSRYKVECVSK